MRVKKLILPALFFAFLLVLQVQAAVNCPSYADSLDEYQTIVRGALLDFLADPSSPNLKITKEELNDLSRFLDASKANFGAASCLTTYASPTGTGETIRFILEKYTKVYEGSSCIVSERSWKLKDVVVSEVYEDQEVTLEVAGSGVCDLSSIGFLIKEDDFLDADDDVLQNPLPVAFGADNTAKGTWKAEWQDDGALGGNPEYYFKTVFNAIQSKENSPLLGVKFCKDEDKDGFKDLKCSGLDCNDDPKATNTFHPKGGFDVNPNKVEQCNNLDDDSDPAVSTDAACEVDNGLLAQGCACSAGAPVDRRTPGKDDCDNWDNDCDTLVDEDVRQVNEWWLKAEFNVCRVDFDGDVCTGVNDFILFINVFGKKSGDPGYDARMDLNQGRNPYDKKLGAQGSLGVIDMSDLDVFLAVYTGACRNDKKCSDPSNPRPKCGVNKGICTEGQARCVLDVWAVVNDIQNPLFRTYCEGAVAPESKIETKCDARDENCDGTVDEKLKTTFYQDADKDGYGNLKAPMLLCTASTGYVTNSLDCNDNDNSIYPGRTEICNNRDDNCNAVKDDGLSFCQCNGGNPAQNDLCDGRDNNCNNQVDEDVKSLGGKWWDVCKVDFNNDKCTGLFDVTIFLNSIFKCSNDNGYDPRADLTSYRCTKRDSKGVCINFDKNILEGPDGCVDWADWDLMVNLFEPVCQGDVKCTTGQIDSSKTCGTDTGECSVGNIKCFLEVWPTSATVSTMSLTNPLFTLVCANAVQPSAEICDGKDNDCDGLVDENALGIQNGLKNTCKDYTGSVTGNRCSTYLSCGACPAAPAEVCGTLSDGLTPNMIDEDCDGGVDENAAGVQYALQISCPKKAANGACLPNVPYCAASCPALPNSAEVCNNADEDCDGSVDEGLETWCACSSAANRAAYYTAGKDLCDGWDNDCDSGNPDGTSSGIPVDEDVKQAGTQWWNVCKVEFTGDRCVGVADLAYLLEAFNTQANTPLYNSHIRADVTGEILLPDNTYKYTGQPDGLIDFTDYFFMVALYEPAGCPGDVPCSPDGAVSNDRTKTCGISGGECRQGLIKCFVGLWPSDSMRVSILPGHPFFTSTCGSNSALGFNLVTPVAEKCDGKDNDCDASTDEPWPTKGQACGGSVCVNAGTLQCNSNQDGVICTGNSNKPKWTPCDDGLFCTTNSACDGAGNCNFSPVPRTCNDNNACTSDSCDENNDRCMNTPSQNNKPETCNGIDDNCNGQVDENVKGTYYRDGDNDGYGNPGVSTQTCSAPAGYVSNNQDCNDADANINPGKSERCNGIDDNCVNGIDETWPSKGQACSNNCATKGTYVCKADGSGLICSGAGGSCGGNFCLDSTRLVQNPTCNSEGSCNGQSTDCSRQICSADGTSVLSNGACRSNTCQYQTTSCQWGCSNGLCQGAPAGYETLKTGSSCAASSGDALCNARGSRRCDHLEYKNRFGNWATGSSCSASCGGLTINFNIREWRAYCKP